MLLEEAVESFLLADGELARLDSRVINTEERVDVIHRLCADVGELLDLGCGIFDLYASKDKAGDGLNGKKKQEVNGLRNGKREKAGRVIISLLFTDRGFFAIKSRKSGSTNLCVRELETELLNTRLDSVPTSQTMTDRNISCETKVLGLEDFVGTRVVEDGLGMDTSLVRESAITTLSDNKPQKRRERK